MESSNPYGALPVPGQPTREGAHQDILHSDDFNSIHSQNLLNFIPPLHNTQNKESLDLHEYNPSSRESLQVENLHSSLMGDDPNFLFDPFSSTHMLGDRSLSKSNDVQNNLQSHPMDFSGQNMTISSENENHFDSVSESPQSHKAEVSMSSHIFSKPMEPIETVPSEEVDNLRDHLKHDQSHLDLGLSIRTKDNNEGANSSVINQVHPQSNQKIKLATDSFLYDDISQKLSCQSSPSNKTKNQQDTADNCKEDSYTFMCKYCPKSYKTQDSLEKHVSLHPYETSAIQCSKCGEILGNYMLLREHKQAEDYLSSCDICGQVFPNEDCMICHIRNTHNDFDDLFEDESSSQECGNASNAPTMETAPENESYVPEGVSNEINDLPHEICSELANERFVSESLSPSGQRESLELSDLKEKCGEIAEHSESVCEDPSENNSIPHEEETISTNKTTELADNAEAETCVERLELETNIQHATGSSAFEEQSAGEDSRSESSSSKPEKLRCQYCSKKCSSRKSLIRHERCHPYGTAAMKCNLCLEVVKNYKALKAHKKNLGSQVSCSTCDQMCPNEICLSCHVRNVHNNSVYEVYTIDDASNDEGEEEGSENYGYSVSVSDPVAPLRITIKQEKEDVYERLASPSYSDSNPPTPPTPSFQVPPTPSPPAVYESEHSDEDGGEEEGEEEEDEYEPYASDESVGARKGKKSKRKSLRSTRRSSANSTRYSLSSEESDHDESGDFNYSPQSLSESDEGSGDAEWERPENLSGTYKRKTRKKNQISDDDSDVDPDWRKTKGSSSNNKKRGKRKRGPLSDDSENDVSWGVAQNSSRSVKKKSLKRKDISSDDDSDYDPDWNRDESAPKVIKKKPSGRRGRKKKLQVQFFLPAIPVPKVNRPRAKGIIGQKAQDAAAALAQAVEDMETTVPELKTVIKPVRRSITKASLKRYNETLDDEDDEYVLDVKPEPKDVEDSPQSVQNQVQINSQAEIQRTGNNEFPNGNSQPQSDTSQTAKSWEDEKEEQVVIKAEPYDFQDDDQSTDLYFSRKFCENNTIYENSNSPTEKPDSEAGDISDSKKELRYVCKMCGRALQYRSHLIRHLRRVHDGEGVEEVMRRMMKCRFCDKPYTNELSLINHEKLHDGTSKMKCNKCEERFDDKNALRRHQRKTHWEHAPVECEICKKQLSDNTCLKAHMKHMHGAEEKKVTIFTCETCGRKLHTKTAFQNHVASKCGTNLLFPCETCGKSFSFKGSLKAHQLLHTGVKSFLCKFCGKSFHQKGEMKRHERKHTGEKPFICEVCGRAFAYRESLLGHSAVHTGIKPFPCKSCGMRFSCSGNLVKHRRSNNCKGSGSQTENPEQSTEVETPQEDKNGSQPSAAVEGINVLSGTVKFSQASSTSSEGHISLNEPKTSPTEGCAIRQENNNKQVIEHSITITQTQPQNVQTNVVTISHITPTQISSVIKSTPIIHVKPTSALQSLPKETKTTTDGTQTHGNSSNVSNRSATQFNQMHIANEKNVTPQSNFSTSPYVENSFRQGNQVNPNDRRFAQFNMENYAGRTDQYFDRQSLVRHELGRQVMPVDRQPTRFLDWTGGVQFAGIDSRNVMQSYPAASIPHTAGYPNLHSSHLGNYAAAHTASHSNTHASVYGGNGMMPGPVGFPAFTTNNQIGMGYTANNIPAHSVTHSNSYPVSHMSHLEALFGHFTHPSGTVNNSFPRLSSHNVGNPGNPSLPGNHRV